MSATTRDTKDDAAFTTLGPDARAYERYALVELEGESVLLYDYEVETAWITADTAVPLSEAL